jgi:capsular polysaccharide export protein
MIGPLCKSPAPERINAIALSKAVAVLPGLSALLGCPIVRGNFQERNGPEQVVLAWGRKPSAARAEAYAARHGLPVWRIEDGFLRSVGLGNQDPPLSIVVDDLGIYYDASAPSRLEAMITRPLAQEEAARARQLIAAWQAGRVSKYNHAREMTEGFPAGPFVLVVDQTWGDASIRYGQADGKSFARMLEAALDEHPESTILLKVHPDVFAGRKRGHFARLTPGQADRVTVLGRDVHPAGLLERAAAVYTVTSQMGFEALLWGKPVRTFGMPFYAGWGLTMDELAAPDRRQPVPLENLVHAALMEYPRYIDPETGRRCEVERVLEHLALQRRMRERFPATVHAFGFSRWKKPIVRSFFQGSAVRFVRRGEDVPAGGTLAVWGRKDIAPRPGAFPEREGDKKARVIRLEDGFLRSVGLGAELVRPLSWVMDRSGMYYDATRPSDLEEMLQTASFDEVLLERARRLREAICDHGVSKYNVGGRRWERPGAGWTHRSAPTFAPTDQLDIRGGNRVVLVPGQVESDASIRYGASGIGRNMDLLRAVRQANPDAYLVYKPHPDVHAGLRRSGEGEDEAGRWCDEVVVDVPIHQLLETVDEVHVLTSLAGFEALLRGRRVVTYGGPFYSGWGLTEDMVPPARRSRKLSLDELIAGAMILYPVYVSRTTGRFTTPERALQELLAWRANGATTRPLMRKWFQWMVRFGGRY